MVIELVDGMQKVGFVNLAPAIPIGTFTVGISIALRIPKPASGVMVCYL